MSFGSWAFVFHASSGGKEFKAEIVTNWLADTFDVNDLNSLRKKLSTHKITSGESEEIVFTALDTEWQVRVERSTSGWTIYVDDSKVDASF